MNIKKSGFTLVELLVVMGVMALFGTLIVTIFSRTLKGSNKSQIIGVIKQNGQAILEKMDKTIRDSDKVVCLSQDNKTLMIVKNGIYTRYRYIPPTANGNGSFKQDNPDKKSAGVNSETGLGYTEPAFVNKVCANEDDLFDPIILTDINANTGVSIECANFSTYPLCNTSPIFKIEKAAGFMDQVTINFNIRPGVGAPQSVTGQIDAVNFKTTIQLR